MLENLEMIGTGFAVVMGALALLWAACSIVGYFFTRMPKEKEESHAPKVPPSAAVAARAGVPPHHLAAIAAAVSVALGPGYRVTRVDAPPHKVSEWPMEGRMRSFSSHQLRTNWGNNQMTLGGQTPNILRGQKQ